MIRAHWKGALIAGSDDTVVIDGNRYFPADAVYQECTVRIDQLVRRAGSLATPTTERGVA